MILSTLLQRARPLEIFFLLLVATVAPGLPTAAAPTPFYVSEPSETPVFENVTTAAGVEANDSILPETTLREESAYQLLNGGRGACVADFDGDGDDDIYVNGPGRNQMFRNDGNFSFRDITDSAGVGDTGYGMGCAVGDLDNDGDEDIMGTNWYAPFTIYRNDGNLTFTNMTAGSGIMDTGPQSGVALADFDNDGLLDFVVTEYNRVGDRIYRNDGDFKFTDKTASSSITDTSYGFQPLVSDVDKDGDPDVYIVNDFGPDALWDNRGNFSFWDVSRTTGADDPGSGMGGAWGDFDGDGDLDAFVTNFDKDSLLENVGRSFRNSANNSGVDDGWVGWGVVWVDYDNDGHMDLYFGNGYVTTTTPWHQPSKLFHNRGNGTFADVSQGSGAENGEVARGVAFGDFDQDGMVDLYVLNVNCPAILLKNVVENANKWLRVKLEGTRSNRDGIGAVVTVYHGNEFETQLVSAGSSYLSSNSRVLNFGVERANSISKVVVEWPSGFRQTVTSVTVNQTLVVRENDDANPIAVAPDLVTRQGERFALDGSGSTDNVRVTNWTWTLDLNGTVTTAFGPVAPMTIYAPGEFQGRLDVRDLFDNPGSVTFRVTVLPFEAVSVDAGPDMWVAEGANISFAATGWSTVTPDFEGQCVFEWWFDTASGRVDLAGPRPDHVFAQSGLYTVFVRVTDPQNATATDSVNVTVRDGRFPVVVAAVPPSVDEDVAVRLDASGSTDNDPTFHSTGSFVWSYEGPSGAVVWVGQDVEAIFPDPGTYTLVLTVSDQAANTVVRAFPVKVRDTTRPVPDAGPDRSTLPGRDLAFTAALATDNDAAFRETGRFEWIIHLRSGPVALGGYSVVFAFDEPGTFQVDLDAWDAAGNHAVAVDSALVTVEDIVPPVPDAGGDRTVGVLDPFVLDASGTTDNDPTILQSGTFVWEFQDGAVREALPGPLANYTLVRAGIYTVRLTVRDAGGNSAAVTFKVTVADLDAPSIVVVWPEGEVAVGEPVAFNASGSRDNVAIASILWRVHGPFAFERQWYGVDGTVVFTMVGNYTVEVTAKDAAGNVANLSWALRALPRATPGAGAGGTTNETGSDTPQEGGTPPDGHAPTGPTAPAFDAGVAMAAVGLCAILVGSTRRRKP